MLNGPDCLSENGENSLIANRNQCPTRCNLFPAMDRGQLILIEGLDRSGKSTQSGILLKRLSDGKLVKFPDRSTKVGSIINEYLTNPDLQLSDQTAHLLFSANRWELATSIVEDLNKGHFVVMDRYIYSGIAYSLAKLKNSPDSAPEMTSVEWLYSPDKGLPKPDLTIFLTLSLKELSNRKGWGEERYEKENFQRSVKSCFLKVLNVESDKSVEIIDVNSLDIDQVSQKIWNVIELRNVNKHTENPIQRFT